MSNTPSRNFPSHTSGVLSCRSNHNPIAAMCSTVENTRGVGGGRDRELVKVASTKSYAIF